MVLLKVMRSLGGCTLSVAKRAIESAAAGDRSVIEVKGSAEAEELARTMADHGAIVMCDGKTYDSACEDE